MKREEFHQMGMAVFGEAPLASQTGFGTVTATSSSVTISMFLGRILLFGKKGRYVFNKTDIKRISRYNLALPGIRIFHSKGNCPPFIVFFSFRIADLEARLKRLGWEIEKWHNKYALIMLTFRLFTRRQTYFRYVVQDYLTGASTSWDTGANPVASIKYFPYGATRSATGALDTEIKFTGQRLDSGVDLYYYGARYYDANIGRFISADTGVQVDAGIRVLTKSMNVSVHPGFPSVDIEPVYPQVLNRYSYALGNPLKYIDPSGQQTVGIGMGFTAGMFGWGVSGSIIYVESQQGGSGFVWSFGAGGFAAKGFGGGGGSAGVIVQYTTADTVEQLRGYSVQTGASGGSGIGAGVEYVGGDAYQGINFNAGIGGGFETHGILEKAGAFIIKSEVGGDNWSSSGVLVSSTGSFTAVDDSGMGWALVSIDNDTPEWVTISEANEMLSDEKDVVYVSYW